MCTHVHLLIFSSYCLSFNPLSFPICNFSLLRLTLRLPLEPGVSGLRGGQLAGARRPKHFLCNFFFKCFVVVIKMISFFLIFTNNALF